MSITVHTSFGIILMLALVSQEVSGQDIYVYPAGGQTDQQLADDRYECHLWAVDESDFDPTQLDAVDSPRTVRVPVPDNEAAGAARKAAVAGAVAGGIIGSRKGDTAEGAVIGAVLGTMAGAAIEENGEREANQKARAEAQKKANKNSQHRAELLLRKSNYRRALIACLEGSGYTVR